MGCFSKEISRYVRLDYWIVYNNSLIFCNPAHRCFDAGLQKVSIAGIGQKRQFQQRESSKRQQFVAENYPNFKSRQRESSKRQQFVAENYPNLNPGNGSRVRGNSSLPETTQISNPGNGSPRSGNCSLPESI